MLGTGEEVINSVYLCCMAHPQLWQHYHVVQHNTQYKKVIGVSGLFYCYYAQNNSCTCEITLANKNADFALPVPASSGSGKWWETKDAGDQRSQCIGTFESDTAFESDTNSHTKK